MRKSVNFIISIVLPVFLFTLLLLLLYIQLFWINALYKQQLYSFENQVKKKTVQTSVILEDELLMLSNIMRTASPQEKVIKSKLEYAIRFCNTQSLSPNTIDSVFFFDRTLPKNLQVWDESIKQFKDATESQKIFVLTGIKPVLRNEKGQFSVYIPQDDNLDMICTVISSSNDNLCAIYTINKENVSQELLPALINQTYSSHSLYYLELINAKNGEILYTNNSYNSVDFSKPDYSWVVFRKQTDENSVEEYIPLKPSCELPDSFTDQEVFQSLVLLKNQAFNKANSDDIQIFTILSISNQKEIDRISKSVGKNIILFQVIYKKGSVVKAAFSGSWINVIVGLIIICFLYCGLLILFVYVQKIRKITKYQSEFIATVTHELKTPLAVILSAADNMAEGILNTNEKVIKYGELIKIESKRLSNTINYYLIYSHLSSKQNLQKTSCNLNEMILESIERYKPQFLKKSIEVCVLMPPSQVVIVCDIVAIYSVIQNMIENVLKHAYSGKYFGIILDFSPKKDFIVLKFIDKGPGIGRRERKKIFDVFIRGEKTVRDQVEGNGIGLNLVKRITELHKGTITLQTVPNQGCVFTIRLPFETE